MECSIRKRLKRQFTWYIFECCTSYINGMGLVQSDTYSSMFTKSDNVNLAETFDRKTVSVHVLMFSIYYITCTLRGLSILTVGHGLCMTHRSGCAQDFIE